MSTTPTAKRTSVGSWRFRLLGREIDTWPIVERLNAEPERWREITLRQDYPGTAHADTECIFLRWPADMGASQFDVATISYPTLLAWPGMLRYFLEFQRLTQSKQIMRAILTKLRPGGHILPHIDQGEHAEATRRAHLVVTSGYGNVFRCGREFLHMQAGELWRFNHRLEHEVWNGSETDRIHLIVDYK